MRVSRVWLVLPFVLALSRPADAAMVCRLTLAPFSFGTYLPGDTAALDVTGSIDIRCAGGAGSFVAVISPGGSGTFAQRQMASGPFRLGYNFYLDPTHTAVWGDGTGGSSTSGAVKVKNGIDQVSLPLYGRVFPRQSVGGGTYSDNVVVTIVF